MIGTAILSFIQVYFSGPIANAFSNSPTVIAKAVKVMFAGSIFFWTYGFQAIGVIFLLCIGKSTTGFLYSIARQGLLFVPCVAVLNYVFGRIGLFYAQRITDIITTVLLLAYLFYLKHRELLFIEVYN